MYTVRKILVATDLSTPARHAVQRAAWLAREHQASVTLQHVVDQGALSTLENMLDAIHRRKLDDVVGETRRQVDTYTEALAEKYNIQVSLRLDTGRVVRAIMEAIADTDPDLLVLGARGMGFVRHMLMGSTPERLLSRTRKPMLVVRQSPRDRYQRVLVPVDFSLRSMPALALAHATAPEATITALHVHHVPFQNQLEGAGLTAELIASVHSKVNARATSDMQALMERCAKAGIPVTPLLSTGDPSHRILEHEHDHDCDLIVLGRHSHDPLSDLAIGSVARHVLSHAQGDVLVAGHPES